MSKGIKAAPAPEIEDIEDDEGFDMDAVIKALVVDKMVQLPKSVQKRVRALKNLHGQFADKEKEYQKEIRELEFKYEKIFAPIFQKRATIIGGEYEPNEEEAKWDDEAAVVAAEEEAKKSGSKPLFEESAKGIPKYWHTVMQNNQLVSEIIFPEDEEALSFLKDIRCTLLQGDQHGFDLDFYFAENPYFTNTVLKKTYHLIDDVEFSQLVFDHATGTKINWKSNKNLTVKLVTKKPKPTKKGGKKVAAKPKVEEEPQDSFFNFFAPMEGAEDDEEEFMESMMEADFEVGCTFKDKLIPQAVRWYTGEAAEFDDYDGDDEGFEDGEDEEGEDDDDEEEDEDEPPARNTKRGGRAGHGHEHGGHSHEHGGHDHSHGHKHGGAGKSFAPSGAGAPGQPGQPECKQQ